MLLVTILGYLPAQSDIWIILGSYAPLLVLYVITYRMYRSHHDVLFFVFVSLLLRCILLFAFPSLSDDIYRFVWDGHLINKGVNPYLHTPAEWLETGSGQTGHFSQIFNDLNSPNYYSVYPPVCQLIFALSVKVFPDSLYWSAFAMKIFFVAAETITIYFLLKILQLLRLPQSRILLYALNPLIIIELCGNLHFEALMICFFVLSLWSFMRKRYGWFGFFLALSVGVKLLPLMFLPLLVFRMRIRDFIISMTVLGLVLMAMFLPFVNEELIDNFSNSLNLYFQKFEFNASIYYLMRWVGFKLYGYNMIQTYGPFLSGITFVSILYLAWREKSKRIVSLLRHALYAFTIYLFLTTTVHPWYLAMPILLSIFTYYRYPVFWSGLIFLTYVNYAYEPYHENLWVVAFEYFVVISVLAIESLQLPIAKWLIDFSKWFKTILGLSASSRVK